VQHSPQKLELLGLSHVLRLARLPVRSVSVLGGLTQPFFFLRWILYVLHRPFYYRAFRGKPSLLFSKNLPLCSVKCKNHAFSNMKILQKLYVEANFPQNCSTFEPCSVPMRCSSLRVLHP